MNQDFVISRGERFYSGNNVIFYPSAHTGRGFGHPIPGKLLIENGHMFLCPNNPNGNRLGYKYSWFLAWPRDRLAKPPCSKPRD